MGRFLRSFRILHASLLLLRQHKALVVLLILSAAATLIIITGFAVPIAMVFAGAPNGSNGGAQRIPIAGFVLLAAMYLVLAFVSVFFSAAVVHVADRAIQGEHPTLRGSLTATVPRIPALLPWVVLSATVSVVLRVIQRAGLIGRIVTASTGLSWTLVTYLVLPLMVVEGSSMPEALRRSAGLLRQTWGEALRGTIGLGLAAVILTLSAVALIPVGDVLGTTGLIAGAALAVAWWAAVLIGYGTLSVIYRTVLYRFSADGRIPPEFAGTNLPEAFAR